jgi:hypothetical protein
VQYFKLAFLRILRLSFVVGLKTDNESGGLRYTQAFVYREAMSGGSLKSALGFAASVSVILMQLHNMLVIG